MRRLVIEEEYGIWYIGGRGGTTGQTLERAIERVVPDAPAEYVRHAAEIFESIFDRFVARRPDGTVTNEVMSG